MGWGVVWASGVWTCGGKWEDTSDFLDASVRVIFTPTLASLWHCVDISSFTRFYLGFVASAVFLEVCRYPLFFSNVEGGGPGGEAGPVECYVSWKSLLNTPLRCLFRLLQPKVSCFISRSSIRRTSRPACVQRSESGVQESFGGITLERNVRSEASHSE